ncbi:hypothetical protein [Halorarius litoreus]|uniref:hypothetical protein n=1 Tax=Halorarius litoreus TaxID=2962676 RepID=UPI0020CE7E1F|nr:hypothetical protein [Halorarius litoreus]
MDLSHRDRSLGTVEGTRTGAERASATGFATYAPGVAAGAAGLVVFLTVHAVLILPIWFVAPLGIVAAVVGGVAVNWAYRSVESHLPASLGGRWVALAGGAILVLTPSLVVAWAGEPYFTVVDGVRRAAGDGPTIAARFVVEFLLVTTLSGAALGWVVTRSRRGALAVAVAALAFALGPGHNLPFFHLLYAPAPATTGLLLTLATILTASAVFVLVDRIVTPSGS